MKKKAPATVFSCSGLTVAVGLAASLLYVPASSAQAAPLPRLFQDSWIAGTTANEPVTQVQALDADTFVIRQSVQTNFEAPFLYLIFGHDKAVLFDSGAQGGIIRPTVDRLVAQWLAAHHRPAIPLIVAHSHSHGDHIAGDAAFRARPDTTVVELRPADVAAFFGIANWPEGAGRLDLGGRVLDIIATPGHQAASIMVYDARLRLLLSGDSMYPGRLYVPVNFMADERASIDRVAAFAATHPIRAVLGTHIEMTRAPGRDYTQAVLAHPDEHRLELAVASIGELQTGLKTVPDVAGARQVHDDFIICPVPARAQ